MNMNFKLNNSVQNVKRNIININSIHKKRHHSKQKIKGLKY